MLWLPLVDHVFLSFNYLSRFISTELLVILYSICCLCIFLLVLKGSSFMSWLSLVTDNVSVITSVPSSSILLYGL